MTKMSGTTGKSLPPMGNARVCCTEYARGTHDSRLIYEDIIILLKKHSYMTPDLPTLISILG
jgi:hypothetical protein